MELIRYVISRQATRRADGQERKTLYIDVNKAHLVPKCTQDVYVELLAEAEVEEDECGKLIYWLHGCQPAVQAWKEHYSGVLTTVGFKRLLSSTVAFYHPERDLLGVVHGDDFVYVGVDNELDDVKDAADSQELDIQECKSYWMLAARLNFISQDNLAIQYSAKEICRNMARPETVYFAKNKKLARFLLGVKSVEWEYLGRKNRRL